MSEDIFSPKIRNCKFSYRCTKSWESLLETAKKSIRYCSECDSGVHLCKTDSELKNAIMKNRCVAIINEDENEHTETFTTLGVPARDGLEDVLHKLIGKEEIQVHPNKTY